MRLTTRLFGAAIAIAILLACAPAAAVLALLMMPLWRWLESRFAIEAVGHSGPAEWCFLAVYGTLVAASTIVWWYAGRRRRRADGS